MQKAEPSSRWGEGAPEQSRKQTEHREASQGQLRESPEGLGLLLKAWWGEGGGGGTEGFRQRKRRPDLLSGDCGENSAGRGCGQDKRQKGTGEILPLPAYLVDGSGSREDRGDVREMFGGCLPSSVTLCHVCQFSARRKHCSSVPIKDESVSLEIVLIFPTGLRGQVGPAGF